MRCTPPVLRAQLLLLLSLATTAGTTACTDQGTQPPASAPLRARASVVPAGASAHAGPDWAAMSRDSLYAYIARGDTSVVVERRALGARRGVERGKVVFPRPDWAAATRAVRVQPGLVVVDSSDIRPELRVKVADVKSLLRRIGKRMVMRRGVMDRSDAPLHHTAPRLALERRAANDV